MYPNVLNATAYSINSIPPIPSRNQAMKMPNGAVTMNTAIITDSYVHGSDSFIAETIPVNIQNTVNSAPNMRALQRSQFARRSPVSFAFGSIILSFIKNST